MNMRNEREELATGEDGYMLDGKGTDSEFSDWNELRTEIAEHVSSAELELARAELHAWERSYKLAEARKRRHLTQVEVAHAMGLTQGRVSQIENGDLGDAEVDTLARYAAAIGGKLRLVLDFGDDLVQIA